MVGVGGIGVMLGSVLVVGRARLCLDEPLRSWMMSAAVGGGEMEKRTQAHDILFEAESCSDEGNDAFSEL